MIPKKIHYCWFSGEQLSSGFQRCIDSWKRWLPDYEIIRWDSARLDTVSIPFVTEALSHRNWAFASDYVRLYALHQEGGIYLDADVLVRRNMDALLRHRFFSAVERHVDPRLVKTRKSVFLSDGSIQDIPAPINGLVCRRL